MPLCVTIETLLPIASVDVGAEVKTPEPPSTASNSTIDAAPTATTLPGNGMLKLLCRIGSPAVTDGASQVLVHHRNKPFAELQALGASSAAYSLCVSRGHSAIAGVLHT